MLKPDVGSSAATAAATAATTAAATPCTDSSTTTSTRCTETATAAAAHPGATATAPAAKACVASCGLRAGDFAGADIAERVAAASRRALAGARPPCGLSTRAGLAAGRPLARSWASGALPCAGLASRRPLARTGAPSALPCAWPLASIGPQNLIALTATIVHSILRTVSPIVVAEPLLHAGIVVFHAVAMLGFVLPPIAVARP